jgi:hypothetical protein
VPQDSGKAYPSLTFSPHTGRNCRLELLPREKLRPADIVCLIDAILGFSFKARRFFSAREYPPEDYSRSLCVRPEDLVLGLRGRKGLKGIGTMGTAGVLRLRATSAVSCDRSVRRSAQNDDLWEVHIAPSRKEVKVSLDHLELFSSDFLAF